MIHKRQILIGLGVLACLMIVLSFFVLSILAEPMKDSFATTKKMPIAILGDSDSHSYHDDYDDKARGGEYAGVTLNWPAIWNRFRGEEVDLGRHGVWGAHYRLARVLHSLGLPARSPEKRDFEYNYAVSGLSCDSLLETWPYQAKWLIQRLRAERDYWTDGLVIIRIGVNNLGKTEQLIRLGETGLDDTAQRVVSECLRQITGAVQKILASHESIRVAVIGMCRDCNITESFELWPSISHINNRNQVHEIFDAGLVEFTERHKRVTWIDDVNWLIERVGDRHHPPMADKTTLNNSHEISIKWGDHPLNWILEDGHSGTVYNGFWLNNLIAQLNTAFGTNLTPLSEKEILSVIEPAL